jgi:hypothetical protein
MLQSASLAFRLTPPCYPVLIAILQPLPSPVMEITFAGQGKGKHGYPGLLPAYSFNLRDNAGHIVKFFILQPQNPHPKLIKEKRPIIVIFFLAFMNFAVNLQTILTCCFSQPGLW